MEFELPGNSELAQVGCAKLAEFAETIDLPRAVVFAADHSLAEHLQNIADHGHSTAVRVALKSAKGRLTVRVADDGKPFDPTRSPDPDFAQPLDKRPIGGLGLYMMRKLMDEARYARRGRWNELVMVKRF